MWSLILTIFSAVILLLSLLFCVWFSYRRGVFNTALRFGCFLLGGIISFVLVKLLSPVIVSSVLPLLTENIGEEANQILSLPTLQTLLIRLAAGVVSPLLFAIVFFLVEKLTFFIYIPLKKKFANHEKLHGMPHDKLYGALLGVVLAIATTIAWVMPISGYTYFAGSTIASVSKIELVELPDDAVQLAEEFANSPIAKVDHVFTGWLFQSLSADLGKAADTVATLAEVADSFTTDLSEGEIPLDAITEVLTSKETATFTIGLIRDLLPTVVPTENAVASNLVSAITKGLDDLLAAQKKLSDEEFQKEMQSLTEMATLLQDPSKASVVTAVETILKSKYISTAITEQSDAILQELKGESITLSKSEEQQLKSLLEQYTENPELKNFAEQLFGLK